MNNKLKLYRVTNHYLNFLREIEPKIPVNKDMFPIVEKALIEIDYTSEFKIDFKYTALLINEDLYINQHKTRIYEIATKTHTNVISKRFGFENFCCDFAKLEDKYKSYIPEFGIGSNS